VSEILIYLGLFKTLPAEGAASWTAGALAIPALALIGGLAVACFVKVSGSVFLGAPRTERAHHAHESPTTMIIPMGGLAACCLTIGLVSPWLAPFLDQVVACWIPTEHSPQVSLGALVPFSWFAGMSTALVGVTAVAFVVSEIWLRPGRAPRAGTWDCGYARPSARMQYTSSSFADMLVRLFRGFLKPSSETPELEGLFPKSARFRSTVEDVVLFRLIFPIIRTLTRLADRMRVIQRGQMRNYVLYIFATVVILLLWTLPVGQLFARLLTR
jgi:hydrogenase-4 component B